MIRINRLSGLGPRHCSSCTEGKANHVLTFTREAGTAVAQMARAQVCDTCAQDLVDTLRAQILDKVS